MLNRILLPFILLLILSSCSEPKGDDMSISVAFDSVMVAADHLSDSGFTENALYIVADAHNRIKPLSVADHIRYYSYCNIVYNKKKKHDKSIQMADSMLLVLENATDNKQVRSWRTVAYNIKADALFAEAMYKDAYNYYFLAQRLSRENKDTCSRRSYSYTLAMTLYRQKRYNEATYRFKEAYDLSATCLDGFYLFYFKQELLDNIGLCYNALGKYDSAIYYYNKALEYLDENTGKFENKPVRVYEAPKAVVYGNLAEVYMHLARYDSAKVLYENSIRINLQKGYTNTDAVIDQVKLADLYFVTGDIEKTRITLRAIEAELDTLPNKQVEMNWHKLMWKFCEHEQDSIRAFRHLRAYVNQNEAYRLSNKEIMATDLNLKVTDIEKQYKIDALTRDKKLSRILLVMLSLAAVVGVIVGFVLWRIYKRSQRYIGLLKELNSTVSTQKRQLQLALDELKLKEKDKARILKSVAHDVMNPIAAIVSLTDILLHNADTYTEEQLEIIGLIREASSNSLNLSRDIIEASRDIDGETMTKEKTDINLLLMKSVELLTFRAMSKKQHIVTQYPEPHVFAYVYTDRMRRVINNLIVNAIKFSYENATIEIGLKQVDEEVHISIKDYGIGIPENNKPYIFDMFTDAKARGTSGEITNGLGLSISLQIAKAHNGNIWFESEEGKGSTFHLVFPVESAAENIAK